MRTPRGIVAIASQKGGVGKTTLAANLSVAFQDLKFKTLLVEADPQGSLLRLFGRERFDLHQGLYSILTEGRATRDCIEKDILAGLDLLPANVWSHEEEIVYMNDLQGDPTGIQLALNAVRDDYDYIVLDCPPGLGPLTRAALAASDRYLVPVQAEAMNLSTLPRFAQLVDTVRAEHNPQIVFDGYVLTMADTRTRLGSSIVEDMMKTYPRDVLQTIVPRSIRVAEESAKGRPTVAGAPSTPVGQAFLSLSEEILSRHAREMAFTEDEDAASEPIDNDYEEAAVQPVYAQSRSAVTGVTWDDVPLNVNTNGQEPREKEIYTSYRGDDADAFPGDY